MVEWRLSGADSGEFDISASGDLTFKAPPDFEARADANRNNLYEVTVEAYDGGLTGSRAVTVRVTNVNEAPVVSLPDSRDFAEHTRGDVADYDADDPEGDNVIWSLTGDDRGAFDISASGNLTFKAPPDFEARADADQDNRYEVTVEAFDGKNTGAREVTVSVTNVEEAGTVALSSPRPQTDYGLAATLTDPDGSITALVWTWERSQTRSGWEVIDGGRVPPLHAHGQRPGTSPAGDGDLQRRSRPKQDRAPGLRASSANRPGLEQSPVVQRCRPDTGGGRELGPDNPCGRGGRRRGPRRRPAVI